MKKVVIPVDYNVLDEATLGFAVDFATALGAELHVITVLPVPESVPHVPMTHFTVFEGRKLEPVYEEILTKATRQLNDVGITRVITSLLSGDPASEIIDYAEREACDLILIHTHGMGVIKRFAVGSVTNTVVLHASVPVLVVK